MLRSASLRLYKAPNKLLRLVNCLFLNNLRCIALLVAILTLSPATRADTFKVGVEQNSYMPYFELVDGKFTGFARELLDAWATDRGHKLIYLVIPIKRLNRNLRNGKIDFRFPDNPTWYQEEKSNTIILYSQPIAISLAGLTLITKVMANEIPTKIGVIRGFNPVEFEQKIKSGSMSVMMANDLASLIQIGLAGRVDAIYGDPMVIRYYMQKNGLNTSAVRFADELPNSEHYFKLSTLHHPHTLDDFNNWLLEQSAMVQALRAKFQLDNPGK